MKFVILKRNDDGTASEMEFAKPNGKTGWWWIRETDYWGEFERPITQVKCSECRRMFTFGSFEDGLRFAEEIECCPACGTRNEVKYDTITRE